MTEAESDWGEGHRICRECGTRYVIGTSRCACTRCSSCDEIYEPAERHYDHPGKLCDPCFSQRLEEIESNGVASSAVVTSGQKEKCLVCSDLVWPNKPAVVASVYNSAGLRHGAVMHTGCHEWLDIGEE